MKTLRYGMGFLVGIIAAGAVFQSISAWLEKRSFPPSGRMVDVGGFHLHINIMGEVETRPVVILEAGMVSASPNWAWIQPEVAKTTCVVAYDRAGLGWSDPGPKPRDAGRSAQELSTALHAIGILGPYVLVGHSYGGLVVRAFAAIYPNDVAGMVLVDGSHPDQWVRFGIPSQSVALGNRVASLLARVGWFRIFKKEYQLLAGGLPSPQYEELMAVSRSPRAISTGGDAALVWDSISRPLVNQAGGLGSIPLIVLSVTDQPRYGEKLTELQKELPALSTNSLHITVPGAYHEGLVARQECAKVVTEAILQVVDAVRTGQLLETKVVYTSSPSGEV